MIKFGKKITSFALAAMMTLGMSTGAFAEVTESAEKNVQLNGTNIVFDSKKPVMNKNRIYAPFESLYTAFGAKVTYDETSKTHTAVKDSTTITYTDGSKDITIDNGSEKKTETIDTAQDGYIPVSTAAAILGYKVGWDADNQTAIVVDKNNLMGKIADYSIMNKYLAYSKEFSNKSLAVKGTFDLDYKINTGDVEIPVTGTGTISGLTDSEKANMDMAINLDLSKLAELSGSSKNDPEFKSVQDMLKNIEMKYIIDLSTGKYYIYAPVLAQAMAQSEDTWFILDLNALMKQADSGLGFTDIMAMSKIDDFKAYITKMLDTIPFTSIHDYKAAVESIDIMNGLFSDTAFQKEGNTYKSNFKQTEAGTTMNLSMSITEQGDKIAGYALDMVISDSTINMAINMAQTNNNCTMKMTMSMEKLLTMVMNMNMDYSPTTEKPVAAPPSGSKTFSINDLLGLTMPAIAKPAA